MREEKSFFWRRTPRSNFLSDFQKKERALVRHSTRLRRVLLGRKRQFGLYYSLVGARLIVSALIDLRQAPEKIQTILDERTLDS